MFIVHNLPLEPIWDLILNEIQTHCPDKKDNFICKFENLLNKNMYEKIIQDFEFRKT